MTSSKTNPKVDEFLEKAKAWQEEMKALRTILLGCELTEEIKWGKPGYTLDNSNVVIIQPFKEYCALLFVKGALLKDPEGVLIQMGENTQAARQIRFTSTKQIQGMQTMLAAYISEAIEIEIAGLKVEFKKSTDLIIPEELQNKFEENPVLETAFESLTPVRQRQYVMYFTQPKQSKTRETRVEKCIQQILDGRGLND